jgi:fucose 4-O-acetylase-like acetyltransferase
MIAKENRFETGRLGWLDIARGIGILLVVLGHNALVSRFSLRLIYSFHMPLFFFLSGFFFNASLPFRDLLRKRFHGLLKPYFFTVFLIYFFYLSFGKLALETTVIRLLKSFYGTGEYAPWLPLWFLPHLFAVNLLAFFIVRLKNTLIGNRPFYWLALLAMLAVGVWTIDWFSSFSLTLFGRTVKLYGLPFGADLLLVSAFFFLAGAESRSLISDNWLENRLVLMLAGIALVAASIFIPSRLDMASRVYPSFVINTLEALIGIWFVLAFSRQLELHFPRPARVFAYLGRISLVVLIFHYEIQGSWQAKIQAITGSLFLAEWGGFFAGVLGSVLLYELFIKKNSAAGFWFGIPPLNMEDHKANS